MYQCIRFGNIEISGVITAVMRFKKGDNVEVLSQKEVPSGSWRCGEIIFVNGHNYTVRYNEDADSTDKAVLERVSCKNIRPSPPSLDVSEYWVPGDVVEVFNNYSWKMATILKILRKKYFLVRLLGSSLEFKVSKFDIRVRQSWQDDKWVVIGEGSGSREDGNYYKKFTLMYCQNSSFQKKPNTRINFRIKDESFCKNKVNIQVSHIASSRTLKRGSPYCYSEVEGTGAVEKFRAVDKDGRLHRVIAADQSLLLEQVDDVAFPREMPGENNMHPFFNGGMTGFCDAEPERRRSTGAVGCPLAMNLDSNDAHSVACSVGSCSINSHNSYKFPRYVSAGPLEDSNGNFSDAESFCQFRFEEGNRHPPRKEDLAAEIHRLELHAYRCIMEALHASGPLSWEQEELVTNLRLSLHISNDEHLMELRSLVSADYIIPIR